MNFASYLCPQTEFLAYSDLGLVTLDKFGLGTRVYTYM